MIPRTWCFRPGRAGRAWLGGTSPEGELVRLPHSWNDRDDFQTGVSYRRGWGSYRTAFDLPAERQDAGGRWFLVTEGFFGYGDLFVNGRPMVAVDGQYLGLDVDITPHLRADGRNAVAFRLCNRHRRTVLPGIRDPDFLLYGGLSGRAWLERRPVPFLDAHRIHVRPVVASAEIGFVNIEYALAGVSSPSGGGRVTWEILSPGGETVARSVAPAMDPVAPLCVDNPLLWSDETPHLYRLRGTLTSDAAGDTDSVELRFGFRTAEFLPMRGFFLNGRRTELRGCNRHECMPGVGRALPERLHREDALLFKRLGLNFVRLSHYPQHPAFLDACDELGLLVYAEIATWKSVRGRGGWLRAACRQMDAMVRRDRHRPSVILWGMGNESRSRRAYSALRETVRRLDVSRPVTYAENHFYRARRCRTTEVSDVWALNYEFEAIEDGRRAARLENVVVSECANRPDTVRGCPESELKQVRALDEELGRIAGLSYVAGFALWCFNDYGTARKKRYARFSGVFDAWRLPKMSADYLCARYSRHAFVRMHADWREPGDAGAHQDAPRQVCVFTNCDEIRFIVNGRQTVVAAGANPLIVALPFEPGILEARGSRGGECVRDACAPWGPAERLSLRPVDAGCIDARADIALFDIRAEDALGRPALDWTGDARCVLDGPALLRAYTPEGAVRMAGGYGRLFVEPLRAGVLCLRAEAPGLQSCELELEIVG